jgi:hypothetical protein
MPRSSNFCAAYPAEPLLVLAAIVPRRPGPQKPGWEASTCAASAHFGDVASWHETVMPALSPQVRYDGMNGPRSVAVRGQVLPSRPGEFHPEPLTDPDLILSHHPARAIARRLPPSTERRAPPGEPVGPNSAAMTHLLRSSPIAGPSSLLRGSPPLSDASVLSASRWEPLAPFPLASPARFSRSVPEPDRASRCLYAGCRSVGIRTSSELVPAGRVTPRF